MALGPLELIVLVFPATRLNDGISAALDRLTHTSGMRVVDALVVRTDTAGGACIVELNDLPGLTGDRLAFVRLASGLIADTDIDELATLVDEHTDAVAVLIEKQWVTELATKVAASDGAVVSLVHIPAVLRSDVAGRR